MAKCEVTAMGKDRLAAFSDGVIITIMVRQSIGIIITILFIPLRVSTD
jgi:uncharacterized membrane protein